MARLDAPPSVTEGTVAVRTLRLPCGNAGAMGISTPVRESSSGNRGLNGRRVDPQFRNLGPISMVLGYLLAAYVAIGIAVALAFVTVGVGQVQPMPVTVG